MTKQKQYTHTANDRTPYTYLIGWSGLDKWYYGVRYAKGCHPTDFWVTYFTSSEVVDEFRKTHGEPDVIEIRKIFDDSRDARRWESRVLKRINVKASDNFLNRTNGHVNKISTAISFENKRNRKVQKLEGEYAIHHSLLWSNKFCLIKSCLVCGEQFDGRPKSDKKYCSIVCSRNNQERAVNAYICTSPDGEEFYTIDLKNFCLDFQLNYSVMGYVAIGRRKQNRGWTARRLEEKVIVSKRTLDGSLIPKPSPKPKMVVKSSVVIEQLEINSGVTSSFCDKPTLLRSVTSYLSSAVTSLFRKFIR